MTRRIRLSQLHDEYIKGTEPKALVSVQTIHLCTLTKIVKKGINASNYKVYFSTRCLKHLYDKKVAEEYDFIVKNSHTAIKYPDSVYKNKPGSKRGNFLFTKEIKGSLLVVSLEVNKEVEDICSEGNAVVTVFKLRQGKQSYLENCELLWSWKGGDPSS